MLPSYRTTYNLDQLSREYKEADIHVKESELVTDQEVCSFINKTMPVLYLLFFLFVIVLSGVLSQ